MGAAEESVVIEKRLAYKRAEDAVKAARAEYRAAIVAALSSGSRPKRLEELTDYTGAHLRQIRAKAAKKAGAGGG